MFSMSNLPWKSKNQTESKRYYYTDQHLFEQSLDVYKPVLPPNDMQQTGKDLPVTLLVVGSGWVGHRAVIYAQTSWWNSSGPQTVATSLGQTCVCIRHRGAFCGGLPSTPTLVSAWILLAAVLMATCPQKEHAMGMAAVVALTILSLKLGNRGSASLEDMLDDVAQALKWIDQHHDLLRLHDNDGNAAAVEKEENTQPQAQLLQTSSCSSSLEDYDDNNEEGSSSTNSSSATPPSYSSNNKTSLSFVFGGYSSGGHVATTLLQRPELFAKYNLPKPEELFQAVLLISGVLAVRPETVPLLEDDTTTTKTSSSPTWLTNFVIQLVWGSQYASPTELPSPITQVQPPKLPHVVLGCQKELPFGLNWLDTFFCPQDYCRMVEHTTKQPARYVEIPNTNHWFILSSSGLKQALQQEIPPIVQVKSTK